VNAAPVVIEAPAVFGICTAAGVRDLTFRLQLRHGVTGIVIDLSAVTFMDNAALGVIVGARARLRGAGGWLAVAAASEPVARLFRVTGLTRLVPMYETAGDAIAAEQAIRPSSCGTAVHHG
jgi:anti-sigma B factor antagonist